MIHLLDINILIALVDSDHPHHLAATVFFKRAMNDGWATCPLTENGFLRILGHPHYPGGPGSPEEARKLLVTYLAAPGHQFWADDLSLTETRAIPVLPSSKQLTDFYLLALAVKHRARLATFDRHIDPAQIVGGENALFVINAA